MQECAYVCNMAVDSNHRRQGYGLLLLEAVEEIARLGGQRDLYLHLRYATDNWQAVFHDCITHMVMRRSGFFL